MYYTKLPIILLSEIASGDKNDTNTRIAAYLLEHMDEVRDDSIRSLAAKNYVSPASISRFCREIGLEDFNQLRNLLQDTTMDFDRAEKALPLKECLEGYAEQVHSCIELVVRSVDIRKLEKLCADIDRFPRVSIYGPLKAATAAMNLQVDLMMAGRFARSKIRFPQQVECMEQADENDLIILFSYTGQYFTYAYGHRPLPVCLKKPKIYMITGNPKVKANGYINEVIYFESKQDLASHPYQLQMVSSLIAQTYMNRKHLAAGAAENEPDI